MSNIKRKLQRENCTKIFSASRRKAIRQNEIETRKKNLLNEKMVSNIQVVSNWCDGKNKCGHCPNCCGNQMIMKKDYDAAMEKAAEAQRDKDLKETIEDLSCLQDRVLASLSIPIEQLK